MSDISNVTYRRLPTPPFHAKELYIKHDTLHVVPTINSKIFRNKFHDRGALFAITSRYRNCKQLELIKYMKIRNDFSI